MNDVFHCRTFFLYLACHKFSVARVRLPLYLAESLFSFFFSRHTFADVGNRHPRNFPTRHGLVFNKTFAIPISSKCPLKRTGAVKPQICIIFHPKSQTFSAPYGPHIRVIIRKLTLTLTLTLALTLALTRWVIMI